GAFLERFPVQEHLYGQRLGIRHEFTGHDKRPQGRKGVMRFSDEPVGAREPRVAASAAIRNIVLERVTKDVVFGAGGRYARCFPANDDAEFTFPVDLGPADRQLNRFAVSNHSRWRFEEHIGIPAIIARLALPDAWCALRAWQGAALPRC